MKTTAISSKNELELLIKETVLNQNKPFKVQNIFEEVLKSPYFENYCTKEELEKHVILYISKMWDIGYIRTLRVNNSRESIYVVD